LQKVKSILEKGKKRVKRKQFLGQQVLFGTKFLKFGPKKWLTTRNPAPATAQRSYQLVAASSYFP